MKVNKTSSCDLLKVKDKRKNLLIFTGENIYDNQDITNKHTKGILVLNKYCDEII